MAEITQNDFSAGWRPSDDAIGGPRNSLVRMQNLKLDELGALTLTPGSLKFDINQFTAPPHNIYSKTIASVNYKFAALDNGQIVEGIASGNLFNNVLTSFGNHAKTPFASAYNLVIIGGAGGNFKFIPSISNSAVRDLSTEVPPTVVVNANSPYVKDMTGAGASYAALVGTVSYSAPFIKIVPDATILSGVASLVYGSAQDSTGLSSGSKGLPTDRFNIEVKADDPTQVVKIVVIFKDFTDNSSYFTYEWLDSDSVLNLPPGQVLKLECAREDFTSVGNPQWTNIGELVVACDVLNTITNFYFDAVKFYGGKLGSLSGDYEYIQIFTDNSTPYLSRSAPTSGIALITVNNSFVSVVVQTPVGSWANGYEIYRRGGLLPDFYLVKAATGFAGFDDHLSDVDALKVGVKLNLLLRGATILPSGDPLCILGPFFNRWLYFTSTAIYISQNGNPELYSIGTGTLTPYGSSSEQFMWAQKFGNSAILVGTSNDIYEITGTFSELPDGTIDVIIRPTGCKNPPINDALASTANSLYYVASDGIRRVTFAANEPFWPQLDLFFKGKTRYGIIAPLIRSGNQDKFILTIAKNELYLSLVDTVGARKMWAYDLLKDYCYEFKSDNGGYAAPTALFTEEDGSLLAGFSDTGNLFVRTLNIGTLIDGASSPAIFLRSKVFNHDLPFIRKDSYTLKLKIDTGSSGIEFRIYKDESASFISLGFISTASLLEVYIDLSTVIGVCKSYQLEINGVCPRFKLTNFVIDYDPRPTQLSYFRSQPTNYGIQGRKRIYEIPIIIDTQSSPVTMTPNVDGVNQTPLTITTARKQTVNYNFNPATAGRDIFYTLLAAGASQFELYGDVTPKVIEPLPDSVLTYIIPYTNLGTFARKRFIAFAFQIDSNGNNCSFTPKVDGVSYPTKILNTLDRRTYIYYFDTVVEGIDIGGVITAGTVNPFEYFGVSLEECVSEKIAPSATIYVIPNNNLGSYARKRFIAFAFVIDTHGSACTFVPVVDGIPLASKVINTTGKRTFIYYFDSRTEGVDIGGTIYSNISIPIPFEYFGVVLEECISEKLPPSCTYLVIPPNNYGVAAKKRIRTIPFSINTKGSNVTFTPTIDGVVYPSSIFNTTDKQTVLYYFITDAFGIDVAGTLSSANNFEFYGLLQPENVETIPVGKLFDQLGPAEFLRSANIKGFRVRLIAEAILVNYAVFIEDVQKTTGSFATLVGIDKTYEIPWIIKFLNGTTCRIELTSAAPMHRFSAQLKATISGQSKLWTKLV